MNTANRFLYNLLFRFLRGAGQGCIIFSASDKQKDYAAMLHF